MRVVLYLLSLIYGFGVCVRRKLYEYGVLHAHKFKIPIISVGNLTAGGSGKTPMVGWLVEQLLLLNKNPCIITRGYNRQTKQQIRIDKKKKYSVNEIGDEPCQLLNMYPDVEMIVSNNKVEAINEASMDDKIDVVVIDDGFQSLYIKRDLDIVMISNKSLENDFHLLPFGDARENPNNLNRASVVIYTKGSVYDNNSSDKNLIRWECEKNSIPEFKSVESYSLVSPDEENIDDNENIKPAVSVCGIADVESFLLALDLIKVKRIKDIQYKDHHNYTDSDGESLVGQMKAAGCDSIITTSKDYEKLRLLNLKNIKIVILKMDFSIDRPSELMSLIKGRLEIEHEA